MVRNSLALVLVSACTINGKPFSPFGGAGGGTAAAAPSEPGAPTPSAPSTPSTSGGGDWGGAPTKAPVVEAVKSVPRCPNGKKYFLGAPEEYPGNGVESVVVADMNGDGKLDIVTGNPHGKRPPAPHFANVGVMMGKGDGTFADMAMYPVGSSSGGPTMSEPSLISAGVSDGSMSATE